MAWTLTGDLERFTAVAGPFLRSRPVAHTVLLTSVSTLRRQGRHAYGPDDPVFGWWQEPTGVGGVLLQTPPYPVMFSAVPAAAVPAAARTLAGRALPGVNMPTGPAEIFAVEWQRLTGVTVRAGLRTRLYRLGELAAPPEPPGAARPAGPADRPVVRRWTADFHEFIGEPPADLDALVDDRLSHGGITLWEAGGAPVSMVARSRLEEGMVRVQNVWTPPELRGRGYAGAATAAAVRAALAAGATDVLLFTDLANPTSNNLYQRLGFRPVEDRVVMEFGG